MDKSQDLYLRISPDAFHYLKFILEGYDNLAILSSHDMAMGVVRVRYISSSAHDLFALLSAIAPRLHFNYKSLEVS